MDKEENQKKGTQFTKSELGDVETHLIWVQGYYKKRLFYLKQLEQRKDSEGRLKYPAVTEKIKNLKELDQNVEQLLSKIKEMERGN